MKDIAHLMDRLGYCFTQPELLKRALTHRSAQAKHNERLEFLGDAALGFIIADELSQRLPEATEGELTRLRAMLVKKETLAKMARELRLSDHLILGPGELKSGGQQRSSILADTLEAILAAIYFDGGLDVARTCVLAWYDDRLSATMLAKNNKDPKTQLQEYLQARGFDLPQYSILQKPGDADQTTFIAQCRIEELKICTQGEGENRRYAEQKAAQKALSELP